MTCSLARQSFQSLAKGSAMSYKDRIFYSHSGIVIGKRRSADKKNKSFMGQAYPSRNDTAHQRWYPRTCRKHSLTFANSFEHESFDTESAASVAIMQVAYSLMCMGQTSFIFLKACVKRFGC